MSVSGETLEKWATDDFAEHELKIVRDDGLYRHLRCQKPGTWIYGFDVITWPGYLAVCGDIGTWVFGRTRDMFEWFEGSANDGEPNFHYWSEKLTDGHERARPQESHDCYEASGGFPEPKQWNAQFVYACYGVILALRLYRKATA